MGLLQLLLLVHFFLWQPELPLFGAKAAPSLVSKNTTIFNAWRSDRKTEVVEPVERFQADILFSPPALSPHGLVTQHGPLRFQHSTTSSRFSKTNNLARAPPVELS